MREKEMYADVKSPAGDDITGRERGKSVIREGGLFLLYLSPVVFSF